MKIVDKKHDGTCCDCRNEGYSGETIHVSKPGPPGAAATIEIADVVTIEPNDPAKIENIGDTSAAKLVFYIPKGDPGNPGPPGSGSEAFDPYAYTLPVLALTGDTTGMTKDNAVSLDYVYGDRNGTCTMKWQGSSSLAYPKKNYTIKFDNAFEAKDGWGEQKKYCLKANYIDHSHARNIVSCKLWGQMVKARTKQNGMLTDLPNCGATDGFPIIIMLNGAFHGLYTFNIPKDSWMFGMGQQKTENLAFDTYTTGAVSVANGYTPTTTPGRYFIKKKNTTIGSGRVYITWDTNKLINFAARAYLYDENGTLVKMFAESTSKPSYTENPYINKYVGDLNERAWLEPSSSCPPAARLNKPFSLPIPAGHTVMWEFTLPYNVVTYPDGTLNETYTQGGDNSNCAFVWAATGINATVVVESDKEAIICADAWSSSTALKAPATLNGDFELEYVTDESNKDWVLTSLNRLINACINSNGTDLDTTVAQYLDWDSAIDYYIHTVLERAADATNKNYILATYDGVKWFFSAYDRDSTYGLYWDGSSYLPANEGQTFEEYASINRVMELIYNYKYSELESRYKQLRAGVRSEYNVALTFENFCNKIPAPIYDKDVETWTEIPSSSTSDFHQILDWYRKRVTFIDRELGVFSAGEEPAETTTVSGASVKFEKAEGKVSVIGNAEVSSEKTVKLIHSGKNLVNANANTVTGTHCRYEDGWIIIEHATAGAETYSNCLVGVNSATSLIPGKKYYIYIEVHEDTNITNTSTLAVAQNNYAEVWGTSATPLQGASITAGVYRYTVLTKNSFSGLSYAFRHIVYWAPNAHGLWKYRAWVEIADEDATVSSASTKHYSVFEDYVQPKVYTKTLFAGHSGNYQWNDITPFYGINVLQVDVGTITATYSSERISTVYLRNTLKQKKIVYDGDSIFAGNKHAMPIAAATDSRYDNQAIASAWISATTEKHSVVNNLPNLPTDGDLYCFEGGINDFWNNVPLGTVTSSYSGILDTHTVCGALETIFRYAQETFAGKPICFVITHKISDSPTTKNANGDTFTDFHDAMVKVCEKYSIPYYDAFKQSGLNVLCDAHRDAFCPDLVHPNDEGYRRYYVPQMLSLFNEIMPR